jgi:hypothetical protein
MNTERIKTLLEKAVSGDRMAVADLRSAFSHRTVFVAPGGKVNISATLAAIEYERLYQVAPHEWGDEPTVTAAQAFAARVRLDPIHLRPVTPGLWERLWESENGHKLVAAIHYGRHTGDIRESEKSIRLNVKALLSGTPWLLLDEVVKDMRRDDGVYLRAMGTVYPQAEAVRCSAPMPAPVASTPVGLTLDALERAYNRGEIDIARYLKLKASIPEPCQDLPEASRLRDAIVAGFNLGEIKTLCFNIGCDHESLRRQTRQGMAQELVMWAKRRGQFGALSDEVRRQNPLRWREYME